ncbi:hypothetical protein ACFPOI_00505 [Nonomuraea angiospora]|uniref:Uncharacterized protein n=1 Tax=Nonomuraea angiospora TaxID=46172 RepID=A0ABR9M1W4_9ACTN|nr:hypothetical protein [Nonomuraea angiospora]MBE1586884.1 hypothetical protein [Nonomuraea angiospora]MDX3107263.1 hypothetical protein [Nonomuraea angiospora]
MKWWLLLASLIVALLTVWLVLYAGVAPSTLLSLGAGAISLLWLVVVLTVPWNLFLAARHVLHEIQVSREAGIEVARHREDEARRIARRMLVLAVSGHVVSAAVIAVVTFFAGAQLGYYFSGFYLLATAFRPVAAYTKHLRDRVRTLGQEVRYPRADVIALLDRVSELETVVKGIKRDVDDLNAARQGLELADHDLGRRMTLMARRFDETVDGLNDNQEVITGLKAFLRLVRADLA